MFIDIHQSDPDGFDDTTVSTSYSALLIITRKVRNLR